MRTRPGSRLLAPLLMAALVAAPSAPLAADTVAPATIGVVDTATATPGTDGSRYAARERAVPQVADFAGGGRSTVIISGGTVTVVLLIVLLVILL